MSRPGPILIFADQPVVAALVGMLIELTGRNPVFPQPGERPVDALRRVRPLAVVLVDVTLDEARSDILFAAAARNHVGTVIFGPANRAREIASIAGERGIPWFIAPPELDELAAALDLAAGVEQRRAADRRQAEAHVAPDGTSIYRDESGRRWMVYDRRGGSDRREPDRGDTMDRVFVSEAGQRFACALESKEAADTSPSALGRQLARAVPL
jgi:DNA-binding NtrC family response regulator